MRDIDAADYRAKIRNYGLVRLAKRLRPTGPYRRRIAYLMRVAGV